MEGTRMMRPRHERRRAMECAGLLMESQRPLGLKMRLQCQDYRTMEVICPAYSIIAVDPLSSPWTQKIDNATKVPWKECAGPMHEVKSNPRRRYSMIRGD